jgi:hypothetical protein
MRDENFIGVYKNAFSSNYCSFLIREFERLRKDGAGFSRLDVGDQRQHKDDYAIFMNLIGTSINSFDNQKPVELFFEKLKFFTNEYINKYSILNNYSMHASHMKMQKTIPGGGYHVWHAEHGSGESANRMLTFILYLNTLPVVEGGETEFLYQKLRVPPEEGTLVIWPAAFTHAHRGNTVLGDTPKYIVTGWFNLE